MNHERVLVLSQKCRNNIELYFKIVLLYFQPLGVQPMKSSSSLSTASSDEPGDTRAAQTVACIF